jgi:NitT/TauT family transport system substrate-binding protein
MGENLLALREGRIDAAQLFEPVVEEALASGAGHLWHAANTRGRTTYTAFVTTRDRLVNDAEPLLRMVRANHRAQQRIHASSAAQLAATISPFFPPLDSGVLTRALARYQAQGIRGCDPILPEDGFDRLQRSLVSSRFIRRPASYRLRRQSLCSAGPYRFDLVDGLSLHPIFASDSWLSDARRRLRIQRRG